jgi:predicted membrane protein
MAKDEQNQFQLFGTFLAFLLPILQFFFTFLPASAKNLFLIRDYFLFVSIATALFSYILILVFKNVIWFQVPLKPKKHRKYEEFQKKTSPSTYSEEEIRQYIRSLKSQPRKPYYITQENAYLVLIPLLLI